MVSSTFELRVSSESREHFDLAMKIAWDNCSGGVAGFYSLDKELGMVFYWSCDSSSKKISPLPYKMNLTAAKEFVWNWLKATELDEEEPDHDGSNNKGWLLQCGSDAKRLADSPYAFLAVKPVWQEYWK